MNTPLYKMLLKRLENILDSDIKNKSKKNHTEINDLSSVIYVYELLHYPVTEKEKKLSRTIKKLFYPDGILISKKDAEIFFDAITNPKEPSEELKKAAKEYKQWIDEKE